MKPTAVYGLVASEKELALELDVHVAGENDPKWLRLEDRVAQGARSRVNHIFVGWIGNDVDFATFPTNGVVTEALTTASYLLAVVCPFGVTSPAFVDQVMGFARSVMFLMPDQLPPVAYGFTTNHKSMHTHTSTYRIDTNVSKNRHT
ncbi:hypothetical protein Hanom_Chr17g01552421 [Helianthus anomalus]